YVREVDGAATVPLAQQHGRSEQGYGRRVLAHEEDIGQAADKTHVGLAPGELGEGLAYNEFRRRAKLLPDIFRYELVRGEYARREEGCEAQGLVAHKRMTLFSTGI